MSTSASHANALTDYQIDDLWIRRPSIHDGQLMPQLRDFARAIIAAAFPTPADDVRAEIPIRVTREMIEAHYKSIMRTALALLSQGEVPLTQDMLSEACRLPYPVPAMQEPTIGDTARLIDAALDNLNAKARGGTP